MKKRGKSIYESEKGKSELHKGRDKGKSLISSEYQGSKLNKMEKEPSSFLVTNCLFWGHALGIFFVKQRRKCHPPILFTKS